MTYRIIELIVYIFSRHSELNSKLQDTLEQIEVLVHLFFFFSFLAVVWEQYQKVPHLIEATSLLIFASLSSKSLKYWHMQKVITAAAATCLISVYLLAALLCCCVINDTESNFLCTTAAAPH